MTASAFKFNQRVKLPNGLTGYVISAVKDKPGWYRVQIRREDTTGEKIKVEYVESDLTPIDGGNDELHPSKKRRAE
jgi:hypothetical protein